MKFENIKNTLVNVKDATVEHSPTILTVAGTIGVVAGVVLACKATLKLEEILEETKSTLETIDDTLVTHPDKYSEEDAKKDKTVMYVRTAGKLISNYALPALLITASVGSLIGANHILTKRVKYHREREASLIAAYATLSEGVKKYRSRVAEVVGEEKERDLFEGNKEEIITVEEVDENGKKKKVKKTVKVNNGDAIYSKLFDELNSRYWSKSEGFNRDFLIIAQNYFNDILKAKGHVLLNDVYDHLGFDKTLSGYTVGWMYDPSDPSIDNYISFGVNLNDENSRAFLSGHEPNVWLTFNVDGDIVSKMKRKGEKEEF